MIISNPKEPWKVLANPVGSDMMNDRQSHPLYLRQVQRNPTRRRAPISNGYSIRYGGVINVRLRNPMPHTLFNLRKDSGLERFDRVNEQLASHRPDYIDRFGAVGTDRWWSNFQSGFISRDIQVGFVTCVGQSPDSGEDPVVVIRTDRRDHAYDLDGFWLDPAVRLNAWIRIERFKIFISYPSGPVTELVDSHIEVLDSEPQPAEQDGGGQPATRPKSK
jgi:hypothetical protein